MGTESDRAASPTTTRDEDVALETRNLSKSFGGLLAVDDVNFQLRKGEVHCLIGPNGAGKSTLLKLLTGVHSPDQGEIIYGGEDISGLHPHERVRRGLSIKFQQISTYRELTVEDNIRIPAQRYHGRKETENRINELLDLLNLEDRRKELAGSLPHGVQQWVEIAMAMAVEPNILFLDEPTAGMTLEETRETGELIQDLVREGLTVLVVEHDINLVRQIAEKVTVMNQGSVFTEGTVEEVTTNEDVQNIYLGKEGEAT